MKLKNSFIIKKSNINFAQTLSCGQIFSYKIIQGGFCILSADKFAFVEEKKDTYEVKTNDGEYFKNFFNLQVDLDKIKTKLKSMHCLDKQISFGSGIRILKQDLLETIISFSISANNNIKRITKTLFDLRKNYGEKIYESLFSFPTLNQLTKLNETDWQRLGVGYRSSQIVKLVNQLSSGIGKDYKNWASLPTNQIKNNLIQLSSIGPKVADCILLFGYGRGDVFPVDTWIEKAYNENFGSSKNRLQIRQELIKKFGDLSGYAQQYLFFYQRENNKLTH